jgi:branched-chain amino acid transport system substrate-binding protein
MKKWAWVLIGLAAILLFVFLSNNTKSERAESITFGVLIPLSGNGAEQGEWIRNGLEIALDEVNEESKVEIDLAYEDTKGDPKNAISAYNQLKTKYTLPAVLTWGSGVALALSPIVNTDKVIQMGVATAADSYTSPEDFNFRVFPAASQEGKFVADAILNQMKINSVVILNVNNDYGISSAKAFKEAYEKSGGRVTYTESYEVSTTDFHTILTKVKNLSPKLIYIASYPTDGALLVKQAREFGIESQILASTAILGGKSFFDITGTFSEGLIVANSAPIVDGNSSSESKNFIEQYTKAHKESSGPQQLYAARAYDAMKIIAQGVNVCGANTECIKEHLLGIKDYDGASGKITLDRNGDVTAIFNLQKIQNGQFVKYE